MTSTDSHAEWSEARLRGYIGETETLTLEFKSSKALKWTDPVHRKRQILDAAKDVAGMANEQGGVIIYGIEESGSGTRREAARLDEGYGPGETASREWFIQFARDNIHPPLPDLEALHVKSDHESERFWLVVLVPQSTGRARQTSDMLFWRRDAKGIHPMTEQEIEDVRSRAETPQLELMVVLPPGKSSTTGDGSGSVHELSVQFRARNISSAVATYVVVTIALMGEEMALSFLSNPEWQHLESETNRKIARSAVASGNFSRWSPINPGYTFAFQEFTVKLRAYQEEDRKRSGRRHIGYVRLDHDGGMKLYSMHFWIPSALTIELEEVDEPGAEHLPELVRID